MNKNLIVVLGIGLLVTLFLIFYKQPLTTPQTEDTKVTDKKMVTIVLSDQNTSGESGTATLVEENGKTVVTVSTLGYPKDIAQPAHIHLGECPGVGAVKYPLTNLVNGQSVTTLEVTLAQLEEELPLGINVHKSVPEAKVYTACGDLKF
jgi:hypothetical protein